MKQTMLQYHATVAATYGHQVANDINLLARIGVLMQIFARQNPDQAHAPAGDFGDLLTRFAEIHGFTPDQMLDRVILYQHGTETRQ